MTRFAIVIPAYKAANTIAETLRSIAACQPEIQQAIAVYLVDDCSPDNQVEVARAAWGDAAPELVIVRPPTNSGQWVATNLGIETARAAGAEWVLLLHADDIAKPDWIREMLAVIHNAPANVASVCSSYDVLNADGHVSKGENERELVPVIVRGSALAVRHTLLRGCWWHVSGCAIHTSSFPSIGGFNQRFAYYGDWDWLLRALDKGWDIHHIPLSLLTYRQHDASISSRMARQKSRIVEQVDIVNHFGIQLTATERLRWHARHAYFALRRLGRDILMRNPGNFRNNFSSFALIVKNALHARRRNVAQ